MRDVSIIGIGLTPVGEHWETSLRHLAFHAIEAATNDAGTDDIQALYVGNMVAGELSHQEHLGALIADFAGLRGIEAVRVEAADASGGAAVRQAYVAVASGLIDTALAVGVDKMTDVVGSMRISALSTGMDADYEAVQGITPAALAALLMRRYMHEYGASLSDFAGFSMNAHANGALNPNAMYRNRLKPEGFAKAPVVAPPVTLFDAAPEGDGAVAVILTTTDRAKDLVSRPVRIAASAIATDTISIHDRDDLLLLNAAHLSSKRAFEQADLDPKDIDLFELHDGYTILTALSLEACGFAERGEGYRLGIEEQIGLRGALPISTFGGLKARGHAGGATGVYQIAEVALQLRQEAGDNQVPDARVGLAQNLGGLGGTAVTHILEAAG